MIVLIDNYDSFTFNLAQYVQELGVECRVIRNDAASLAEIRALRPSHVIISPGPGTPDEAGISLDLIRTLGSSIPVLGVCLGHQAIGQAFGGTVIRARRPVHGKTAEVRHDGTGVFRNLPSPLTAARYHSLVVERATLPACLRVTAETADGTVMGIAHRELPIEGVQFHPESIATPDGRALLRTFLGPDARAGANTRLARTRVLSGDPVFDVGPMVPSASGGAAQRVVRIGDVVVGGSRVPVIAGPCAVEPGYLAHAVAAAEAGAAVLRGCVHKPRTRPTSFQGLGSPGIPLLLEARARTGLPVLAEPLSIEQLEELVQHVDVLMIGARSMQNTPLLRAAGRSGHPVVLKRAPSATYDEWLGAADYITTEGNRNVMLCERGIRTFETATRNTLDVSAIAVLRDLTDLPILIDPSHAAGNAAWVPSLALAAVAAGADGLIIESHPQPAESWSDAGQALVPDVLRAVVDAVDLLATTTRHLHLTSLEDCREAVASLDHAITRLADRRDGLADAFGGDRRRRPTKARAKAGSTANAEHPVRASAHR
ncbi:MAG: hypothetical protein NVS3B18_00160 [Candidatus Dormibacteria bacterium]